MGRYKKIRVLEHVCDLIPEELTGDFPECIQDLEDKIWYKISDWESDTPEYNNCRYRIEGDYYGHDGGFDFFITCERDETDVEYEKRVAELKKENKKKKAAKEKKREEELALLEKLKKKYPDAV